MPINRSDSLICKHITRSPSIIFVFENLFININNYLSTSDGQIQDSIELQGPYGIVFTSLIFFLLLGIIRMFIGPDNQMEET